TFAGTSGLRCSCEVPFGNCAGASADFGVTTRCNGGAPSMTGRDFRVCIAVALRCKTFAISRIASALTLLSAPCRRWVAPPPPGEWRCRHQRCSRQASAFPAKRAQAASLLLPLPAPGELVSDLPVHLHRVPQPLRVWVVVDVGSRQEARPEDRRLRADR